MSCTFLLKKGFTLIELLVVVFIIGILAAIALPQYQIAVEKSRAIQAIAIAKGLEQAQAAHFLATGSYAESFDQLGIEPTAKSYYNNSNGYYAVYDHYEVNLRDDIIAAIRKNTERNLLIFRYTTGERFCCGGASSVNDEKWPKICASLGYSIPVSNMYGRVCFKYI